MNKGKVTLEEDYHADGITLYVNDHRIMYTDHDCSGWAGVEMINHIGEELAKVLDFELEYTQKDDEATEEDV